MYRPRCQLSVGYRGRWPPRARGRDKAGCSWVAVRGSHREVGPGFVFLWAVHFLTAASDFGGLWVSLHTRFPDGLTQAFPTKYPNSD